MRRLISPTGARRRPGRPTRSSSRSSRRRAWVWLFLALLALDLADCVSVGLLHQSPAEQFAGSEVTAASPFFEHYKLLGGEGGQENISDECHQDLRHRLTSPTRDPLRLHRGWSPAASLPSPWKAIPYLFAVAAGGLPV